MAFADYKPPVGKFNVPHEPLHQSNRTALGGYLKNCWQTMVRCYTMATELGMDPVDFENSRSSINWKNPVGDVVIDLFGHHKDKGNCSWVEREHMEQRCCRVWYEKETVSDDEARWAGEDLIPLSGDLFR